MRARQEIVPILFSDSNSYLARINKTFFIIRIEQVWDAVHGKEVIVRPSFFSFLFLGRHHVFRTPAASAACSCSGEHSIGRGKAAHRWDAPSFIHHASNFPALSLVAAQALK